MTALPQGKIIIITAPSGSGKTTLVKRLLHSCPQLGFSISACTRPPRAGEAHGKDYYFYEENDFRKLIDEDAFVEWEMVYTGKYYGTLKSEMERLWGSGKTPLVDIDVKGALAIQERYRNSSLSIFIKAPSLDILRERLMLRGSETEKSLQERLDKAAYELSFLPQFDKVIVNDNLEMATQELIAVIENFLAQ